MIQCKEDILHLVRQWGVLPFFRCSVEGFSIEELTPAHLWFAPEVDGPWEWKDSLIASGVAAYGKFFNGKAGYITLPWLGHLINYRRGTYPQPTEEELRVVHTLQQHESLLSTQLKKACGFGARRPALSPMEQALTKGKGQGGSSKAAFDALMTRLQMGLQVCTAGFEYKVDRRGRPYGWGIARYSTPELMYGAALELPDCAPQESLRRLVQQIQRSCPQATEAQALQLLK